MVRARKDFERIYDPSALVRSKPFELSLCVNPGISLGALISVQAWSTAIKFLKNHNFIP